jgi:hypothetical protein
MSTTTTIKKPINGGPVLLNGTSSYQLPKKSSSENHRRVTLE